MHLKLSEDGGLVLNELLSKSVPLHYSNRCGCTKNQNCLTVPTEKLGNPATHKIPWRRTRLWIFEGARPFGSRGAKRSGRNIAGLKLANRNICKNAHIVVLDVFVLQIKLPDERCEDMCFGLLPNAFARNEIISTWIWQRSLHSYREM